MKDFKCQDGQSFSDVCVNTYGSLDSYIKMLIDNDLSPNDDPRSNQSIMWDTKEVKDQSISNLVIKNKIIFATKPTESDYEVGRLPILLQENGFAILQENGSYILL